MQTANPALKTKNTLFPNLITINTTLYDLIEVINQEVEPSNDSLVTEIISDLYNKGIMKLSNVSETSKPDVLF